MVVGRLSLCLSVCLSVTNVLWLNTIIGGIFVVLSSVIRSVDRSVESRH